MVIGLILKKGFGVVNREIKKNVRVISEEKFVGDYAHEKGLRPRENKSDYSVIHFFL